MESCCYGIASLTFQTPANANFVIAAKGLGKLVALMESFQENYDLLDHAVLSLNNICIDRKQTQIEIVKTGMPRGLTETNKQ